MCALKGKLWEKLGEGGTNIKNLGGGCPKGGMLRKEVYKKLSKILGESETSGRVVTI